MEVKISKMIFNSKDWVTINPLMPNSAFAECWGTPVSFEAYDLICLL